MISIKRTMESSMKQYVGFIGGLLLLLCRLTDVRGQSTTGCEISTYGKIFYMAFMEVEDMEQLNLQIFASRGSAGAAEISVIIEAGGQITTAAIDSDQPLSISFPSTLDLMLQGSSLSQKGVSISASADVSVLSLVENAQACSAITILPTTGLGRRYIATTYAPNPSAPAGNFLAQIAVVGAINGTQVQFTLPASLQGTVTFSGTTYTGGQTITVTLNRLSTVQIQSESDLTGTLITSSADVAAFCGNVKASLSESVGPVMEQLLPISSEATPSVYIFRGYPNTVGYAIKLVATQADTTARLLTQSDSQLLSIPSVGSFYVQSFASGESAVVESSQPLQAMQIGLSPPSLMLVPSTISYLSEYRFAIPFDTNTEGYINTILLVATSSDINSFQLDGVDVPLDSLAWQPLNVSEYSYMIATLSTGGGYHVITNTNVGAKFAVAVYGSSSQSNCAFAYPAGMCLDWIKINEQVSPTVTLQTQRATPTQQPVSVSSEASVSIIQSSTVLPLSSSTAVPPSSSIASTSLPPSTSQSTPIISLASGSPSVGSTSIPTRPGTPTRSSIAQTATSSSASQTTNLAASSASDVSVSDSSESSTSRPRTPNRTPQASSISTMTSTSSDNSVSTTSGGSSVSTTSGLSSMTPTFGVDSMSPTSDLNSMSPTSGLNSMSPMSGIVSMSPTSGLVSMSPTVSVGTESLSSSIGSTDGLSTPMSPSETFTILSTSPVSTIGPSSDFTALPQSTVMTEGLSTGVSGSPSSDFSESPGSPTLFSSSPTASLNPTDLTGITRMPTDFSTMSAASQASSSSRLSTDFTTVSGSITEFSPGSGLATNSSALSTLTTMLSNASKATTDFSSVTSSGTAPSPTGTSAPVGASEYTVPVNVATRDGQSVVIHITNPSDTPITVTLSFPGSDKDIPVDAKGVHSEFIARPSSFPSQLPTETARLKSENPFTVSVTQTGSCSEYLAIPTIGLGMSYQVITWDPSSSVMGNAWFTVSTVNSTLIKVVLPEGTCIAKSSYISLSCGDEFSVQLPENSAITFTSIDDLSGTTVESSGPVLVVAGNEEISMGSPTDTDDSVSELFPVEAWGTKFVVPAVPDNDGSGFSIKMSSGGSSATVTIESSAGTTTHELSEGQATAVDFTANPILYVTSNNPIQIIQFVRGAVSSSDTGSPAALYVTSTSLYLSTYYANIWLSKSQYENYVTVVIEGSALSSGGGLMMEDEAVESTGWVDVPGSTLKTKQIEISAQRTKFSHSSEKFGLFRYSYLLATDINKPCALAYVVGADYSYATKVQPTMTTPSATSTPVPVSTTVGSVTTAAPSTEIITDCSCLNLTSKLQPSLSGQYFLESKKYNNNPVYKKRECDIYLFDYEDNSVGYWLVGPELGSKMGYIANPHIYRLPNETEPDSWKVYDPDSKDFVEDPDFKLACSCSFTKACEVGEFMMNGTSLFDGVFTFSNKFYNGRPIYWHESHSLVLYYKKSGTEDCEYWVVSDMVGSTDGIIYSFDSTSDNPGDVTWQHTSADSQEIVFSCYTGSVEDS